MIVIYDFDGTLTPYSLPQYKVMEECGYPNPQLLTLVQEMRKENNHLTLYEGYFEAYKRVLATNQKEFTKKNVCYKASEVQLNKGVLEYFSDFASSKTELKHYVVTSGFREYVAATPISKYLDGIFGTTFVEEKGIYTKVEQLMNDESKVTAIKEIQEQNHVSGKDLIYFGDGLTDQSAFAYVHSIGGKAIYVCDHLESNPDLDKLKQLGVLDEYFHRDFRKESGIYNYMKQYTKMKQK